MNAVPSQTLIATTLHRAREEGKEFTTIGLEACDMVAQTACTAKRLGWVVVSVWREPQATLMLFELKL